MSSVPGRNSGFFGIVVSMHRLAMHRRQYAPDRRWGQELNFRLAGPSNDGLNDKKGSPLGGEPFLKDGMKVTTSSQRGASAIPAWPHPSLPSSLCRPSSG